MTLSPVHFSSECTTWGTPQSFLDVVRRVDAIGLDPCTTPDNPTGARVFYTEAVDGLAQPWHGLGLVFCNPPYGRNVINKWTAKAQDAIGLGAEVLMLLPARMETGWMQQLLAHLNAIVFLRGRVRYVGADSGAPFPNIVAYAGRRHWRFVRAFREEGVVMTRGGGWSWPLG